MEIKGKVHCFFEQSGTFKREFIKLGIPAEDYDIQNNFGETDHVMDLFTEIRGGYAGQPSVFDRITSDDLIMAFFPCIYFCAPSQMNFTWGCINYRCMTVKQKTDAIWSATRNVPTSTDSPSRCSQSLRNVACVSSWKTRGARTPT